MFTLQWCVLLMSHGALLILCDAFVYSKGSVGMRLLSGSMPAPSKMVLMGPLLRSTVSHLWQRELQPSICAVSQLECWFHAFS